MAETSERVRRRVSSDFPHHAGLVAEALANFARDMLPSEAADSAPVERLQVAAVLHARGDLRQLQDAIALGRTDWRDLLVGAGLADEDWPARLAAELP